MKKIFTIAAAVLASFSLWAADPDLETYNWGKDDFATVFTNHDGITLSSDASAWKGNFSGTQYVALGGGTDMSASAPTPYFGITAEAPIDSIEVFWAPNGTNQSNVACAVWADAANLLKQDVDALVKTESYTGSKSLEAAIWQKIDLSQAEYKAVMLARQIKKAKIDGTQQSNFGDNQTVNILGIRVWLKATKTIVSTVETLTAVTINDVAISATDLATLVSNKYLFLEDAYVTAPVVKFTKHTVITYDDQTTKKKDEVIEVTSQPATTTWGASATINGDSYYVYTSKAASRTVTYMYGEQVLGTETVAANGNPAEYAQYETMPLATFGGWYKDADLTQAVANIAAEVISADATYYAKFTKAFLSKNVNIEQLVLDYGTKYDIKAALTDAGWAYANLNDLDTLNDLEKKDNRNYAFLGLKMKTKGAYIQGNLKADGILLVKFGNLADSIKVTVKGATTDFISYFTADALAAQGKELPIWGFTEDVLVTIATTSKNTIVLKQLMLDEIAEVTLPDPSAYLVTCAEAENGKVEANWDNKKYRTPVGATVTLTATPNEGYELAGITVDGVSLEAVESVYSFIMPAKDVTVAATFSVATALENVDASKKAVKVIQNGQLLIKKGNMLYNAQGAVVQ